MKLARGAGKRATVSTLARSALSGMIVRPLEVRDIGPVMDAERNNPGAPHWSLKEYQECLHASPGRRLRWAWVAESAAGILGFAVVRGIALGDGLERGLEPGLERGWERGLECELESIVVRPEAQRNGVGQALLGTVIRTMKTSGATVLMLEVRASNLTAMRLYERHGVARVGVRPGYYSGPPEDAVLMRLEF